MTTRLSSVEGLDDGVNLVVVSLTSHTVIIEGTVDGPIEQMFDPNQKADVPWVYIKPSDSDSSMPHRASDLGIVPAKPGGGLSPTIATYTQDDLPSWFKR